jgi:magnesium transporter
MSIDALSLGLVRNHPRDAARTLEQIPVEELAPFLSRLPPAEAARVTGLLTPQNAAQCVERLAPEVAARMLERMPTDIAAVLLRRLDRGVRQAVLAATGAAKSAALRLALRYSEAVVGSVLDPDVLAVTANTPVAEALELVKQRGDRIEEQLYVINDRQRLVGIVEIKRLLVAAPGKRMQELAAPVDTVFSARASLLSVRNDPVWARINTAPVVDHNGLLLGGISRDSIELAVTADGRSRQTEDAVGAMFSFAESLWGAFVDLFASDDSKPQKGARR